MITVEHAWITSGRQMCHRPPPQLCYHGIDQIRTELPGTSTIFAMLSVSASPNAAPTALDVADFVVGTVIFAILSLLLAITQYRVQSRPPHTRLTYGIRSSTALLTSDIQNVQVLHDNRQLTRPYILNVYLSSTGRHSITSQQFDNARPLKLTFSASPVALLAITSSAPEHSPPDIRVDDENEAVAIGPGLLHTGQTIEFQLLLDGKPNLSIVSSLADVRLKRSDGNSPSQEIGFTKKVLTWAGISFLVFFAAFRPAAAADVLQTLVAPLGDLGSYLLSLLE